MTEWHSISIRCQLAETFQKKWIEHEPHYLIICISNLGYLIVSFYALQKKKNASQNIQHFYIPTSTVPFLLFLSCGKIIKFVLKKMFSISIPFTNSTYPINPKYIRYSRNKLPFGLRQTAAVRQFVHNFSFGGARCAIVYCVRTERSKKKKKTTQRDSHKLTISAAAVLPSTSFIICTLKVILLREKKTSFAIKQINLKQACSCIFMLLCRRFSRERD